MFVIGEIRCRLPLVMAIPRFFQHTVNGCGVNGFQAVLCNLTFMAIWEERLRQGPSHPVSPVFTQKFTTVQQTALSQLHASIPTFFGTLCYFCFFITFLSKFCDLDTIFFYHVNNLEIIWYFSLVAWYFCGWWLFSPYIKFLPFKNKSLFLFSKFINMQKKPFITTTEP